MIELKLLRKIRVFFWSLYQSIKSRIGKSHCLLNLMKKTFIQNFSPSKITITKTITIIYLKRPQHTKYSLLPLTAEDATLLKREREKC